MSIQLSEAPMTWVFTGDSITQAVLHTHGARGWVEHLHERIRWQLDRLSDVVINTGVSGWTAPKVLGSFEHLVGRFNPEVVSISLGTNDAKSPDLEGFRSSLSELARRALDGGAQVILHTPVTMSLSASQKHPLLADYAQIARDIASESGAILVDHYAHWSEAFGSEEPIPWLDDPRHPNTAGHLEMAELTLRTLGLGPLVDRP
ncbi:lysophospholipase L1-like esterase [Psychromicrobium silvestre]|uniref:Lysophospholipase L1-like esterase n=1 Tax=Psychromicrobium silvestre TaxID=1645614 RepID=A0A7Y9S3I8_9MICC|nr:SGNH/GDSL hydrolase family protein [Psychromicrobium silvestre]NYE93888.1 lysophospholipase L1-like esterase [Psychromicrobium silvestre]